MEYRAYIKSGVWKAIRQSVLARDNHTCQKCGRHRRLVVHHTYYPAVLGTEPLDSLMTLCEDCHNVLHGGSPAGKKKPKKKKYAPKGKVFTPEEIRQYCRGHKIPLPS